MGAHPVLALSPHPHANLGGKWAVWVEAPSRRCMFIGAKEGTWLERVRRLAPSPLRGAV